MFFRSYKIFLQQQLQLLFMLLNGVLILFAAALCAPVCIALTPELPPPAYNDHTFRPDSRMPEAGYHLRPQTPQLLRATRDDDTPADDDAENICQKSNITSAHHNRIFYHPSFSANSFLQNFCQRSISERAGPEQKKLFSITAAETYCCKTEHKDL